MGALHHHSLGGTTDTGPLIHSVEDRSGVGARPVSPAGSLFPGDPAEVLLGKGQQRFELADAGVVNLAGLALGTGVVEEALGLLGVPPGHIEGVFEGGFVFQSRVLFHGSIVVPFPGRFQRRGREREAGYPTSTGSPAASSVAAASLAGNDGGFTPAISSMTRTTWQL